MISVFQYFKFNAIDFGGRVRSIAFFWAFSIDMGACLKSIAIFSIFCNRFFEGVIYDRNRLKFFNVFRPCSKIY